MVTWNSTRYCSASVFRSLLLLSGDEAECLAFIELLLGCRVDLTTVVAHVHAGAKGAEQSMTEWFNETRSETTGLLRTRPAS